MRRPSATSRLALAAGAALALVLAAAPAGAHVEPSVTEVPAGASATVEFAVEHGCDGSPTVAVEFQLPDGVTDAAPVDKPGWTSSADGRVVAFRGGPLAADVEDTFAVTFTAPDAPGTTLAFPFVQTCEQGSIDWIQVGVDEPERPAPLVQVVAGDPATTAAPTTTAPATASTTTASTTEPAPATTAPTTTTTAPDEEGVDGAGSSGGVLVVGVVVMTAIVVGATIWLRRRDG